MRTVHLYGHLGEKYGSSHRISAESIRDVMWWGQANFGDFFPTIKSGSYQIIRGGLSDGDCVTQETLGMNFGKGDIHIVPVAEGSGGEGSKGIFTTILGVALLATAFIVPGTGPMGVAMFTQGSMGAALLGGMTYTQLAILGGTLALAGISQMLSPVPQITDYNRGEDKRSFLYNGPTTNYEQGGPLPIVVGRFMCPSHVVSTNVITTDFTKRRADGPFVLRFMIQTPESDPSDWDYVKRVDVEPNVVIYDKNNLPLDESGIFTNTLSLTKSGNTFPSARFEVHAGVGRRIHYMSINEHMLVHSSEQLRDKTFTLKNINADFRIRVQFLDKDADSE